MLPSQRFDLHNHSTASDGALEPAAVLELARAAGLDGFALTDHDTLAGFDAVRGTQLAQAVGLVSGIEFSTQWSGLGVHVVGLDFDPDHPAVREAVQGQQRVRGDRGRIIAERLRKQGLPDCYEGALKYSAGGAGQLGRPHFAQYLVEIGRVQTVQAAFDRWLGNGKPADVKQAWPELAQAVGWIKQAGGIAVLAHPLKYKLTRTKLRRLVTHFREVGGEAIEVAVAGQQPLETAQIARLAEEFGLLASLGTDFHEPGLTWCQIGRLPRLPEICTGVWTRFRPRAVAQQPGFEQAGNEKQA
jgi:predicted metal-dependent phosphoesterase TrpH